ncbi:MAG: TetR family transcriptional regulator C-terminal domain-containing protein [Tabrizicola sp.]|nr:TetR family transcriptional regulator C-terminal domain-containing protein [Tabrizicola sp.]
MAARQPKFERLTADQRRERLVEASIACLATEGIQGFTVDAICRESGSSRGLIVHHFGSKNALLAAVYAEVFQALLAGLDHIDPATATPEALTSALLSGGFLDRKYLNVWLALWGEVAVNAEMQAEHRKMNARFRDRVAQSLDAMAAKRGVRIDGQATAVLLISLTDGLWLQTSIDPSLLSAERARDLCLNVIAAALSGGLDP